MGTTSTTPQPKRQADRPQAAGNGDLEQVPVRIVRIERVHPNEYNPNRMTAEEFSELVAEVKHLGRLPKPVVVRPNGEDYLIVDGEHGWRAAREAGFSEVACEIIGADDFEAMRQTYKRNQHGTHHPVLLGKMFRSMMEARGLSRRALADEIGVSEGSIRNALLWTEAAELRNGYACGDDSRFEQLGIRELRLYVALPAPVRDAWVDSGADLKVFDSWCGGSHEDIGADFQEMADAGLGCMFNPCGFSDRVKRARGLMEWRSKVIGAFPTVDQYMKPAADLGLSAEFLDDHLPITRDGDGFRLAIEPDEWEDILKNCTSRAITELDFEPMVRASVRVAYLRKGVDPEDVTDPRVVAAMGDIRDAPEFIRDADYLTVWDKLWLHRCKPTSEVSNDLLLTVKQCTCEAMKIRHDALTGNVEGLEEADAVTREQIRAQLKTIWSGRTIDVVFKECLEQELRDRMLRDRNVLFEDRGRLTDEVLECLRYYYLIRECIVDGRPAAEVLRERLDKLDLPEFKMLAGYVLTERYSTSPTSLWFFAIGGKDPRDDHEEDAPEKEP